MAEPLPESSAYYPMWRRRAALILKIVVVAGAVYQTAWPFMARMRQLSRTTAARYGIYDVDTFTLNGEVRPAVSMNGKRWRRVIVNESGTASRSKRWTTRWSAIEQGTMHQKSNS